MTQQITMDESLALARLRNVSDSALRILTAAWWLSKNGMPTTANMLSRRTNERVAVAKHTREELMRLGVWPPEKTLPTKKPATVEAEPPIEAKVPTADGREVRPEYDELIEKAAGESPVQGCIKEYDRVCRRLNGFKLPRGWLEEQMQRIYATMKLLS